MVLPSRDGQPVQCSNEVSEGLECSNGIRRTWVVPKPCDLYTKPSELSGDWPPSHDTC